MKTVYSYSLLEVCFGDFLKDLGDDPNVLLLGMNNSSSESVVESFFLNRILCEVLT